MVKLELSIEMLSITLKITTHIPNVFSTLITLLRHLCSIKSTKWPQIILTISWIKLQLVLQCGYWWKTIKIRPITRYCQTRYESKLCQCWIILFVKSFPKWEGIGTIRGDRVDTNDPVSFRLMSIVKIATAMNIIISKLHTILRQDHCSYMENNLMLCKLN